MPKAIVVLRAGFAPSAELAQAILGFACERLASCKRIRLLEFGELPKTLSGKIRRVELCRREARRVPGVPMPMEFREARASGDWQMGGMADRPVSSSTDSRSGCSSDARSCGGCSLPT